MLMTAAGLVQRGNTWMFSVIISDSLGLRFHKRLEPAWRGEGLRESVYFKEIYCNLQPRACIAKKVIVSFLWLFWLFWHFEMFTKGQRQSSRHLTQMEMELFWPCVLNYITVHFLFTKAYSSSRSLGWGWGLWCHRVWGETQIDQKDSSFSLAETILSWAFPPPSVSFKDGSLVQQLSGRLMWCCRNRLLCGCWGKSEIISYVSLPWSQAARDGCSVKSSSLLLNSACVRACLSLPCYCSLSLSSTESLHPVLHADSLPAPPPVLQILTHLYIFPDSKNRPGSGDL